MLRLNLLAFVLAFGRLAAAIIPLPALGLCPIAADSPEGVFCLPSAAPSADVQESATDTRDKELERLIRILETSRDNRARADASARLADFEDQYAKFVKPLSAMLVERDEVLSRTAVRMFQRLGKKAVDALDPDFSGDLSHLRLVCSAINAVGDSCESYIPALLEILKTEDDVFRRTAATFALTGFSKGCPEAIDDLLRDLDHEDMNVTLFAMRLIIKTGSEARPAIPRLVNLLENGVPSQRGYAIWSLAAIGPTEEFDTVATVGTMLNRFTVSERERALIAAGLLGEAAREHVPKIREMMNATLTNIEGQAAIALWQITGEAEASIQRLIELSRDSIDYEITGLKLIAEMGEAAAPAIDLLLKRLDSGDPSLQVAALDALRAIGKAAQPHAARIRTLMQETSDPLVKLAARQVLESWQGI
jgi:HEAT repeat protein